MRASLFDRRCTFRKRVAARTPGGGVSGAWTEHAVAWCSIEPLRGREFMEARGLNAEVTHRIRTYYSEALGTVTPEDRIEHDGRRFDIQSVLARRDGKRYLEIMARELVAGDAP